jgi:D-alanine-D-alanine ligase and related ATP-grasp enzymes
MTYDLREDYLVQGYGEEETAEFDAPETIAAIESVLKARGFTPERIGDIRKLAARLVAGERWDLVFNIAEGLHGIGREAQVPALLDAYSLLYTFSDPLTLALTLDKAMAKRVIRDHGIPTAPFAVVETEADLGHVAVPFPLFVKPLAEGTGKGIGAQSYVASRTELAQVCTALLARFRQPVLVEAYLPGREFTVGITGNGENTCVIGVMEVCLHAHAETWGYTYENKARFEDRVAYRLVDDAEALEAAEVALAAWRALRCRDGGRVDLRSDASGKPHFLELNPLPGLHPAHSDLVILARLAGIDYDALLKRIIDAALLRHSLHQPRFLGLSVAC